MATYAGTQFKDADDNIIEFTDPTARSKADAAALMGAATRHTANGIGDSISNYVPLGRDLSVLYASQIGGSNPWTWLKTIAASGKWDDYDIQIGDYLPVTLNDGSNTKMIYQIAAFDLYYGVGDTINGHHITMVPAACYKDNILFNDTATNQGNETETTTWRASKLFKWCNEDFYGFLPSAVQGALKDLRVYQPIRYSAGNNLTDDNGGAWISLGKVWVPSEIEVWGSIRRGSQQNGTTGIACTDRQIPIFANGRTVLRSRALWWERVAASGSASTVCYVHSGGISAAYSATYTTIRALPCFHIG